MPAATPYGPEKWRASGTETNASASTVVEITNIPAAGAVIRVTVEKTAGSATEVNPSITPANSAATLDRVYAAQDAADRTAPQTATYVDEAGRAIYVAATASAPTLYLWLGLDAGSDNTVKWAVAFVADWD